ncbi:MAG: hypothetical protein RLZZ118_2230 [Bacteroidota bacterium]|jgi:hypothetical protein
MTFTDFKIKYDRPNTVVLLEGKRNVLPQDQEKLFELGKLLASKTNNIVFRSGNASGADEFFTMGVNWVDKSKMQLITPYTGHRSKYNATENSIALDTINLVEEPLVVLQSKHNKRMINLIDNYVNGMRDSVNIKSAYIIRDTIKVIGTSQITKANFAIFYDDLKNPMQGGTGHTINICKLNNVPYCNQTNWMNWLNQN